MNVLGRRKIQISKGFVLATFPSALYENLFHQGQKHTIYRINDIAI